MTSTHAPSQHLGLALMLTSVALFTGNVLLIRWLADLGGTSTAANLWRCIIGVILAVALTPRGQRHELRRVIQRPLLIVRGLCGGGALVLFYLTLFELSTGRAMVINLTYVLWGSLMAAAFLNESLRRRQLAGMGVALAGLPLLVGLGAGGVGWADGVALLGAVMAGAVVILIRYLVRTESSKTIYASQSVFGALILLPFADFGDMAPAPLALGVMVVGGVLVAAGQMVMTLAYRHLPVARGASMQLLIPVTTTLGGIACFGERYSLWEGLGGALILAGCLVAVTPGTPNSRLPSVGSKA